VSQEVGVSVEKYTKVVTGGDAEKMFPVCNVLLLEQINNFKKILDFFLLYIMVQLMHLFVIKH
jgi:hypothetical protein